MGVAPGLILVATYARTVTAPCFFVWCSSIVVYFCMRVFHQSDLLRILVRILAVEGGIIGSILILNAAQMPEWRCLGIFAAFFITASSVTMEVDRLRDVQSSIAKQQLCFGYTG